MGRVAAAAVAVLVLAGCGERAEPVASVPVTRAETVHAASPTMGPVIEALGLEGGDRETAAVVAAWSTDPDGVADARRAGARGFVGEGATVDGVVAAIARLGVRAGAPDRARAVVDEIEDARRRVAAAVAGREPVRVFVDLGFYATAGNRTLIGDLVREAGGTNVAGDSPEPGPFPTAELRDADPEVFVISSESRTRPDDVRDNPQLAGLDPRFVSVPADWLAPGPLLGRGLLALAEALHPDALD